MIRSIGINKQEARYDITYFQKDQDSGPVTTHFTIDCACGKPSGNWIKSFDSSLEESANTYMPQGPSVKPAHTFHIGAPILENILKERYEQEPMEIGCRTKKCKRVFSFTRESYDALISEIHQANPIKELSYNI